jgi:hypothetical protein
VKGLLDLVNEMKGQYVHFKSLIDSIDTKTPGGRSFFHVMARTGRCGCATCRAQRRLSPSLASVVSSVVPSLRTGERILSEASPAECHFLRLVEVDTKRQSPNGNTKIEPLTSLEIHTEAHINLKLSSMLALAITNASNFYFILYRPLQLAFESTICRA